MNAGDVWEKNREKLFEYLELHSNVAVVVLDCSGAILHCNQAFLKLVQLSAVPLGKPIAEFLSEETAAGMQWPLQASLRQEAWYLKSGTGFYRSPCLIIPNNDVFLVFFEKPLLTDVSFIEKFDAINRELSSLSRELHKKNLAAQAANRALQESEAQVRLLLDSTAEAIYGIDLQGNCTFANSSCLRILGYERMNQLLGKNMHALIHHSHADGRALAVEDCKIYQAFSAGEKMHVDDEVLWKADGSAFPAEYRSYPQRVDGRVTGAVVTFNDITERRKIEEQILHLATHDALTGLPSRRLFNDRLVMALGQAHRYKTRLAVMFIDLDGFKSINDTFGHGGGDYLLKHVAGALLSSVRQTDTVARMGGDEFMIVITDLHSAEAAAQLAEKFIRVISRPVALQGSQAEVGASVGIALYPDDGDGVDQLMKLADDAMYEVKNRGKNGYRFAHESGPAKNTSR